MTKQLLRQGVVQVNSKGTDVFKSYLFIEEECMTVAFTSNQSYTVQPGDFLAAIALKFYNDQSEASWRKIYEANKAVIGPDPMQLQVGMVLVIPVRDRCGNSRGDLQAMLNALGELESGLPTGHPNQYQVENSLGFMGKYQFGEPLLIDLGYYQAEVYYMHGADRNNWQGNWTGKRGIGSKASFLNAPEVQEAAIREAFALNWSRLNTTLAASGQSVNDYLNRVMTFNDQGVAKTVTVTLSGLLAGAHLRGPYGVADLLLKGMVTFDEFKTSILRYVDEYGGYAITPEDFT